MGKERRGDERKAKEIEETVVCNTQLAEVGDLGRGAGIKSGERHRAIAETAEEDRRSIVSEGQNETRVRAACYDKS